MQRTVLAVREPPFQWLDIVNPSRGELEQVAREYGLHPTSVQDSLDPEHLPKHERFQNTTFLILRAYDEGSPADGVTVQEMTRKVAIFICPELLLTIHRKDQPYLTAVQEQYAARSATGSQVALPVLLVDLVNAVVATYAKPLEAAGTSVDAFEDRLFGVHETGRLLRDLYVVKRRVGTMKRMLWHTLAVLQQMKAPADGHAPLYQDARENAESWYLYADELQEDLNNLLQVQFSLASHRTNEVIRVLTIFSAFFLPLTFLVGVYGMNFRHMPELEQPWGYAAVWGVMIAVTLTIFFWVRRRGWLR